MRSLIFDALESLAVNFFKLQLDSRSISLARIAVAGVMLASILQDWPDRYWFWTDQGLLSLYDAKSIWQTSEWTWNLLFWDPLARFFDVFYVGYIVACLLLLFGFQTRLATLLCWILVCCLQMRNPYILQGYDQTLRLMLFWAMFIPWGAAVFL